ncbi:MAG: ABC transporter ATP-binding protein [Deltaproteobacteria bacterium]|jgi:ABC-2 type transport system ATP-binding protein|nr:ABC transporter ATP-binding protein [Deltaproteobacteria bacterium]
MIKLSKVTKLYRRHAAVKDLSLHVPAGEIYGFLGPNGAGKTTTIRMVAGALAPSSGSIFLGGYDLAKKPREAKTILGYIPDRPFLYEKLSGREFLSFTADLYRVPGKEAEKRAAELLELFELWDWRDELIENYSHGMKQRLIMGGALLPRPRVLVVDEPMVGLDPRGAKLVMEIFKNLARGENVSIFISTHTMSLASRLCDRIGIISKGILAAEGTESDLKKGSGVAGGGDLEDLFLELTSGSGAGGSGDPEEPAPASGGEASREAGGSRSPKTGDAASPEREKEGPPKREGA